MTGRKHWMPALAAVAFSLIGVFAGCDADRVAGPGADSGGEAGFLDAADFEGTAARVDEANPAAFDRVDRMGMPAVATAVITSKSAYNQANPTDDAAGTFVPEIVANVTALHTALDDDLLAIPLAPCAPGDCVGQAAPFVVPDVIRIDPTKPSGFPNGRRLTDPVIDVTLALVLLDLNQNGVGTLIGTNPTKNDRRFKSRFPYLANPHRVVIGDDDDDGDDDDRRDAVSRSDR